MALSKIKSIVFGIIIVALVSNSAFSQDSLISKKSTNTADGILERLDGYEKAHQEYVQSKLDYLLQLGHLYAVSDPAILATESLEAFWNRQLIPYQPVLDEHLTQYNEEGALSELSLKAREAKLKESDFNRRLGLQTKLTARLTPDEYTEVISDLLARYYDDTQKRDLIARYIDNVAVNLTLQTDKHEWEDKKTRSNLISNSIEYAFMIPVLYYAASGFARYKNKTYELAIEKEGLLSRVWKRVTRQGSKSGARESVVRVVSKNSLKEPWLFKGMENKYVRRLTWAALGTAAAGTQRLAEEAWIASKNHFDELRHERINPEKAFFDLKTMLVMELSLKFFALHLITQDLEKKLSDKDYSSKTYELLDLVRQYENKWKEYAAELAHFEGMAPELKRSVRFPKLAQEEQELLKKILKENATLTQAVTVERLYDLYNEEFERSGRDVKWEEEYDPKNRMPQNPELATASTESIHIDRVLSQQILTKIKNRLLEAEKAK